MLKGILLILFGVWIGGFGGLNLIVSFIFKDNNLLKEVIKKGSIEIEMNDIDNDPFSNDNSESFSNHEEDSWNK